MLTSQKWNSVTFNWDKFYREFPSYYFASENYILNHFHNYHHNSHGPTSSNLQFPSLLFSSRSCQVKDWGSHKPNCRTALFDKPTGPQSERSASTTKHVIYGNRSAEKDVTENDDRKDNTGGQFRVNFAGAVDELKHRRAIEETPVDSNVDIDEGVKGSNQAVNNLVSHESDSDSIPRNAGEKISISVKANKSKSAVDLYDSWSSEQMMNAISDAVQIPQDKLKLVCRGKLITADNVKEVAKPKALFQAIGEKAESEAGLVTSDIDVIMSQLSVERNVAIRALRETGDVVDAMLRISNKWWRLNAMLLLVYDELGMLPDGHCWGYLLM